MGGGVEGYNLEDAWRTQVRVSEIRVRPGAGGATGLGESGALGWRGREPEAPAETGGVGCWEGDAWRAWSQSQMGVAMDSFR